MNVMEIVSIVGTNGATWHAKMVAEQLLARGHQVTVVCRPRAWIGEPLARAGAKVVHSQLRRWPLTDLREIAQLCRDRQIDVVHTHNSRASAFGVLLRLLFGVPAVATAHNRRIQLHWALNSRVIANSEDTARFHRRYNLVRPGKIETIPCFIDYDRLRDVPVDARLSKRKELGLSESDLVLGQVGSVCPRKGMLYLVRALPQVLAKFPRTKLLAIGPSKTKTELAYAEVLRREVARLGVGNAIQWLGLRTDVPELLAAIDVCVLASLEEAQGLSVIEAMAHDLPVVASAVDGLAENITHEQTGLLVPPANPGALAAAINQLLGDAQLRSRLGAAGHQLAREQFSAESQMPRIEAVLAAACGKPVAPLEAPTPGTTRHAA